MLSISPGDGTSVTISGPTGIGSIRLWAPETICTDIGCAAVYPPGTPWKEEGGRWTQEVPEEASCGEGNCPKVDADTFECCGIRIPHDGRVAWRTTVIPTETTVEFLIRLKNVGATPIRKAGGAVCVKFVDSGWWSDERVFVRSDGEVRSLAQLGRNAGQDNGFQAYLLHGQWLNHPFYQEFWGYNESRLDLPVMVSENPDAGLCVAVEASCAYFLHSNPGNPCTDLCVAFGDLAPGEEAETAGRITVQRRSARAVLA